LGFGEIRGRVRAKIRVRIRAEAKVRVRAKVRGKGVHLLHTLRQVFVFEDLFELTGGDAGGVFAVRP